MTKPHTPKIKRPTLAEKFDEVSRAADARVRAKLVNRLPHLKDVRLLIVEWVFLVLVLIVLAITQAFWFTNSYTKETYVRGGTLTEATLGKVNSLNPLFATTSSEKTLSRLLFATLVSIDYSGNPSLMLARTLTPSEDGKVWTMTLKDRLKWSDGEDLTVEDVMFTIDLIKSPQVSSVYDANLANVRVDLRAETNEIVFRLPASYADFNLALDFPIVPKHKLENAPLKTLIEDDFSVNPVSSGAFSFNAMQTTMNENERLYYLSANPYFLEGAPLLSSFGIHTYGTREEIAAAVASGVVSATAELSALPDTAAETAYATIHSPLSSGVFLFFNLDNATVSNRDLRAAIREGLNLEAIRQTAGSVTPLNYPLTDLQILLTSFPALPDFNESAATAKIAGLYGDSKPHLSITTVDTRGLSNVAETVAANLRTLGLTADVVIYPENQEFLNNVVAKRNYEILLYDIELGADPDLLPYYHSSQASGTGLNLSNYKNALTDDLLISARATLDTELRARKYESFLEYWVRDIPAIALYQPDLTYIYAKTARIFNNSIRLVTPLDRFNDVYNWAVIQGEVNLTP